MHARHRSGPGNGYRSNAMGMGSAAAASRISPESSMRGHRIYNSNYRTYRGAYGRGGYSKQFQPPPPPPRETDIFVEAGRLAAEYLVSRGVLPPNALSGKWQYDGLKSQMSKLSFRSREAENTQISVDGRVSAHNRLNSASLDAEPSRRRYFDEHNSIGSKNSMRARRTGSFQSYGPEANRELERSASRIERIKASSSLEGDTDGSASAGQHDGLPIAKDGNAGLQIQSSIGTTEHDDTTANLESDLEISNSMEDVDLKANSYSNEQYLPSDVNVELMEHDDSNKLNAKAEAIREGRTDNDESEQYHAENKDAMISVSNDDSVSRDNIELVKHTESKNVPAYEHSLFEIKDSKGDQDSMNEDKNVSGKESSEVCESYGMNDAVDSSNCNASSHQSCKLITPESDIPNVTATEKEMDVTCMSKPGEGLSSDCLSEKSVYEEQSPDEGLSGFGSSTSLFIEKGVKRAIDETDDREGVKRLREWVPPIDGLDGSVPLSSSMEIQPSPQESINKQNVQSSLSDDQKCLDISLFPQSRANVCDLMEEKQLFPSSFKTCDLNLVGTGDVHENHDANHGAAFPSVTGTGKEAAHIDVDLSISNNCNLPNRSVKRGFDDNDIEIIDLDNDSGQEDKPFSSPGRRGATVYTDLDDFPNNVHNAPDGQDGYGLMISELLGNGSPNSSSVATDLNSLDHHMGLPNGEGILGDDDSIYMSLGEIPISLLGAWEQPTQDYGKPF